MGRVKACLLGAGIALGSVNCGSSPSTPAAAKSHTFNLETWLTSGREGEAMGALITVFRQRVPDVQFANHVPEPITKEELAASVANGTPPDTFQAVGGTDIRQWVAEGALAPLDGSSMREGWPNAFSQPALGQMSMNGSLYAAPLTLERDNVLFYNKSALTSAGLAPPTTIAEVDAVARTLVASGHSALAVSSRGGWTLPIMAFESVLLAETGPDFYEAYLAGRLTGDAPEVRTALTDVAKLLDSANADRATITWYDAVDRFCRGESAMLLMPDFVKSRLADKGCLDPIRIGYVVLEPARAPTFVFMSMTFILPKDAANPEMATAFLEVAASQEGQRAFNLKYGNLPPRADVDLTGFDFISVAEAADWRNPAEHAVLGYGGSTSSGFQKAVNAAFERFADPASPDHKNVDRMLGVLRDNYAIIAP
jgi:glucose/mannose transport system substrate-binding protein